MNPKALKIYDLQNDDWAAPMNEKRLRSSIARLKDRSAMSPVELQEIVPRGMPRPSRPKKEEIEAVEQYVEIELQARAGYSAGKRH